MSIETETEHLIQDVNYMISLEASVIIDAPIEKVWTFISDFDTMTLWGPGVREVKWERPIGVGSLIVVTAHRFRKRTADMKITDWEPTRKIGVEARSGGAKVRAVITMEPVEVDKTRLTRSARMEIGGLLKLIQPYISYRANKDRSVELDNVKRIVETQRSGT